MCSSLLEYKYATGRQVGDLDDVDACLLDADELFVAGGINMSNQAAHSVEDIYLLRDSSYTFRATGNDAGRFLVKLSPDGGEGNRERRAENFAYLDGDNIVVTGEGLLQVYDAMGSCLLSKDINSSFIIPHSSFSSGVYMLRLGEKSQKIVIR